MTTRFASLLACVALAVLPLPAGAFNQAGHFYTSYALVQSDAARDQALIALCAQLPDMASDIDAIAVYKSAVVGSPLQWYRWATADAVDTDATDIRRLVTVQHLLHNLTGGDAGAVTHVARSSMATLLDAVRKTSWPLEQLPQDQRADAAKKRGEALCALGFGFHFYGDSVAHRRLRGPERQGERETLYSTGKGHAADFGYPDYPMCDGPSTGFRLFNHCVAYQTGSRKRFAAWIDIFNDAGELLDIARADDGVTKARHAILDKVIALSRDATDRNDWQEERMREELAPAKATDAYRDFILSQKTDRNCESVLASAFARLRDIAVFKDVTCARVWERYADVVRAEFRKEPSARQPIGTRTDFETMYLADPLSKGPVSPR